MSAPRPDDPRRRQSLFLLAVFIAVASLICGWTLAWLIFAMVT